MVDLGTSDHPPSSLTGTAGRRVASRGGSRGAAQIVRNWELYLLVLPPLLYFVIFRYIPMYGAQIAFRRFSPALGIWGSPWVGLEQFVRFLSSSKFSTVLGNTLLLSLYKLVAGFPIPIILALALHYCSSDRFKRTVQMVTYAPHFISVVVIAGIVVQVLSPRVGVVNRLIMLLGSKPILFMGQPEYFRSIFVWSDIWQEMGWGSILFLAALAGINPEQHEAAIADGASKLQRILFVDIPGIMPTAMVLLILNVGRLMFVGFEKALLLQNPLNLGASEIIDTYVYKIGLASAVPNFSYSTAIGLFSSAIGFVLLLAVNRIARTLGETSLW
jgi:putative aldouronate transport system permease protein